MDWASRTRTSGQQGPAARPTARCPTEGRDSGQGDSLQRRQFLKLADNLSLPRGQPASSRCHNSAFPEGDLTNAARSPTHPESYEL